MKEFLKGNYKVAKTIEEKTGTEADSTDAFEKKALSRLGGSICFVSKKGFLWKGDGAKADAKANGPRKADR
jgi:hypothetical protein